MVPTPLAVAAVGYEIHLTKPGSIINLTIRPQQTPPRTPALLEATIDVQAAGLNFRDVLNVLGLDPTGMVRPVGGEMAGIISTVGSACGHVLPSERAYGLAPGSLRSRVWCDARYIG
jgi:NADPH:quinone reductase-like Zn-dependent oxidoreductase